MFCIGRRPEIINNFILIIIVMTKQLSYITATRQLPQYNDGQLPNEIDNWSISDGTKGDLYDIIKKRVQRIQNELTYHKLSKETHQNHYENNVGQYIRNWKTFKDFKSCNLQPQHNKPYLPSNLYRRQTEKVKNSANSSSLYPSVLTKALEISLNPSVNNGKPGNSILANVAQQMNTSTLELAEKLTKSADLIKQNDSQLNKLVESYVANIDSDNKNRTTQVKTIKFSDPQSTNNDDSLMEMRTTNLKEILERVLNKLEKLHDAKNKDDEDHPDGTPCDIIGSWYSTALGLCFDILLNTDRLRSVSPAEINNRILSIEVHECTPPKHHNTVDLEWKFGGSALKDIGGPFYMYSQKKSEHLVGTFLGYCRTCGGIDTIFGSWTFLYPSKDCLDISLAFDGKRDMFRRNRMEMKRKERFKDLLYQRRIGKSKKSSKINV